MKLRTVVSTMWTVVVVLALAACDTKHSVVPNNATSALSPAPPSRRHPLEQREWRAYRPVLVWQQAQQTGAGGVAFAPDGKTLANGLTSGPGTWHEHQVRLRDVATGKPLRNFVSYNNPIKTLAFSPDGKLLVGAGDPLVLWDVATGKTVRLMWGHADWNEGVAFSPDGKTLASSGLKNAILLWDVATGKTRHILVVPVAKKQPAKKHSDESLGACKPWPFRRTGRWWRQRTSVRGPFACGMHKPANCCACYGREPAPSNRP